MRHFREPDAHVDAEGRHVGNGNDQDLKAIGPTGNVTRHRAEIILGIARERAGLRVIHRHFAQCAHDDKGNNTADQVSQQDAGASHSDGLCGAVKQTGTNGRTQGHKTNVARTEATFELIGWSCGG
ncbi:hypothetical protein D3C73_240280 [compost metagenome]